MNFDFAEVTDVGLKRKQNEDAYRSILPPDLKPSGALFMVADGMGGMGGGDVASKVGVETATRVFYEPGEMPSIKERLQRALEAANQEVRNQDTAGPAIRRMGATTAGIVVQESLDVLAFSIGDCRVYHIFDRDRQIELLTHDQSITQARVDSGLITVEEARQSRDSNVLAFLGQPTPIAPFYRELKAQPDDVFVICSDGMWDAFERTGGPRQILKAVDDLPAESAAHKMVETVRRGGAPDNLTVIIVRLGPPPAKQSWLSRLFS